MEKVGKNQYQAAHAVAWQGSSRVKIYEELGWESLSERRMCKRVLQIHKIVDRRTPSYLRDKMPLIARIWQIYLVCSKILNVEPTGI